MSDDNELDENFCSRCGQPIWLSPDGDWLAEPDGWECPLGWVDGEAPPHQPANEELFGWRLIAQSGTCDGCSEGKPLRYEWPETEAWLCPECWHDATEIDRLKAAVERLSVERDAALTVGLQLTEERDTARAERDEALSDRDNAQSAAFAAMEHYNATLGRALKAENELAAAVAERDTARAALKDAEQQNELLEDDVLRFLRQRNAALERAAAHFHPGPDGADDIIRRELVREWVDEGHDRVDEEDRQRLVAVQRMIAAEAELAAAVVRTQQAEAALAEAKERIEWWNDYSNEIAEQIPEHYDGDEAQEAIILRFVADAVVALSENTRLREFAERVAKSDATVCWSPRDCLVADGIVGEEPCGTCECCELRDAARAALATPAEPEVETRPDLRTEATWRLL